MCAYVTRAFQYANDDVVTACAGKRALCLGVHEHINTLIHWYHDNL